MSQIEMIGVPMDLGAGRRGTDMGPSALRLTELGDRLRALGHQVSDAGNLPVPIADGCSEGDPRSRYVAPIASVCHSLGARTEAIAQAGGLPLILGGDHSVSMGSVNGVASAYRARGERIGLIWIDAHGDINTADTSPSGNVHGMPLAALLGHGLPSLTEIGGAAPAVLDEDVVLYGVRELDPGEQARLAEWDLLALTMSDIDRHGVATSFEQALQRAGHGTAGVYVSLDLDAIDPRHAPGVGTPVLGGLTYREAHLLMEMLADSGLLIGMDLTEINPSLDQGNATAELAAELAESAFGRRIL